MKYYLAPLFFLLCSYSIFSQHIRLNKKEMAFLASQEKVNVVFTYDSLRYNADNFTERQFMDYIKQKIEKKLNSEEASDWERRHLAAKDSIYPKIFVASLNNRIKNYDYPVTFVLNDPSLKYTMKLQTNWMYFGYDAGIAEQPAKGNLIITFFETAYPNTILSEIEVRRAEGFDVVGNFSFPMDVPLGRSGIAPSNWLDKFLKANEDYPKPSLRRMGYMYDKAAQRFGMTLKRVLD